MQQRRQQQQPEKSPSEAVAERAAEAAALRAAVEAAIGAALSRQSSSLPEPLLRQLAAIETKISSMQGSTLSAGANPNCTCCLVQPCKALHSNTSVL